MIRQKKLEEQRKAQEIRRLNQRDEDNSNESIDNFFEDIQTSNSSNETKRKEKQEESDKEVDFAELFNLED